MKFDATGISTPARYGFWAQAGDPVYISADMTVKPSGVGAVIDGFLETSIGVEEYPTIASIDSRFRVNVIVPENYVLRGVAGGVIAVRAGVTSEASSTKVVTATLAAAGSVGKVISGAGAEDAAVLFLV